MNEKLNIVRLDHREEAHLLLCKDEFINYVSYNMNK